VPWLKLTLEYDGARFVGWQVQAQGVSVQGRLTEAIQKLSGETVSLRGAGRTDAGVHAIGQVAHFDLARTWPPDTVRAAVNFHLKPDPVAVLDAIAETGHEGTELGPPGYFGDAAGTSAALQERNLELVGSFLLLPVGAIAVAAVGAVIEPTLLRPLYRRPEEYHLLVTFGLLMILEDAMKFLFGGTPLTAGSIMDHMGSIPIGRLLYPTYNLFVIIIGLIGLFGYGGTLLHT